MTRSSLFWSASLARKPVTEKTRRKKTSSIVEKGRLRVHDPFELIRWLALSQPDPRKALAELVQNSLDARATKIRITRIRVKKLPCLKILDDGEGVIPELDRAAALRYVATHIGHSRKRDLSPQERLQLMTQGQYGIGLLGFWSLGETLEIRTHQPGQKPYRLTLHRNRPEFEIEPLRGKLDFDARWTEVVVVGLSKDASAVLTARRASDYLAGELRGQLLARSAEVIVEDKIARGRSAKLLHVRPPRFLGERLEGLTSVDVPAHAPARVEIYVTGEDENDAAKPIALYAAGTVAAGSFSELEALGLDHAPWTDDRLTGFVDFPEIRVAPGSRRGIIPDAVAYRFAEALVRVEPLLNGILETKERERAAQLEKNVIRDLQRAFRDFYKKRPSYTMLPTERKTPGASGAETGGDATAGAPTEEEGDAAFSPDTGADVAELFPPGPMATVEISPRRVLLDIGGEKVVRARALDETGRQILEGIHYQWEVGGEVGALRDDPSSEERIRLVAAETPAEGILSVHAREGASGKEASVAVPVEIVEALPTSSDEGIPEPELVDRPGASWRSRIHDGHWQVNTGHADFGASATRPALKLRYLAMLFAKEVILRSRQDPRLEEPLEQMVEVAAYADRQLTERPPRRRRRKKES